MQKSFLYFLSIFFKNHQKKQGDASIELASVNGSTHSKNSDDSGKSEDSGKSSGIVVSTKLNGNDENS